MLARGRVVVIGKRKRYTPEYGKEAAALVLNTDRPIARVAEKIDVGAQLLGRWVQQESERRGPTRARRYRWWRKSGRS